MRWGRAGYEVVQGGVRGGAGPPGYEAGRGRGMRWGRAGYEVGQGGV